MWVSNSLRPIADLEAESPSFNAIPISWSIKIRTCLKRYSGFYPPGDRCRHFGGNRSTRGRLMPSCLFTDPQVAHIGLSETSAQRLGVAVQVAKVPTSSVLRTQTISETRGFMKALI